MVIGRYFVVPGSGPASGSARLLPKLRFQRSFGHATGIALFRFDRLVRRVRILEQEREHVGSLFDALRDGFAGAVARLGVDADQDRSVAALGVLHLGGELERMSRHDTVIVVGSRYQRRRILRALLDVMQRGVFVEVAELLLVVARAVLYVISDSLFKSAPYCNNICWVLYQKKSNNVYVFPILILTEKFFKLSANVFCLFFLVVHGQIWFSTWFSTEPVWH